MILFSQVDRLAFCFCCDTPALCRDLRHPQIPAMSLDNNNLLNRRVGLGDVHSEGSVLGLHEDWDFASSIFFLFWFLFAIFSCLPRLLTNHDMRLFSFVLYAYGPLV